MTELDVRKSVVNQINSWLGFGVVDGSYEQILNLYNSHKPIARGYAIQPGDAWCATTVSAVAIALGYTDIMPTEVSCPEMVKLYQKHSLSRWEENDSYRPQIGDIILYDWQDSGSGDNRGTPDHIGIVTSIEGVQMTITEGNYGGRVGKRFMSVNSQFIRGYCLPNYAWKAAQLGGEDDSVRWETIDDVPKGYYRDQVQRLLNEKVLAGSGTKNGKAILNLTEDMLRCILICERMKK